MKRHHGLIHHRLSKGILILTVVFTSSLAGASSLRSFIKACGGLLGNGDPAPQASATAHPAITSATDPAYFARLERDLARFQFTPLGDGYWTRDGLMVLSRVGQAPLFFQEYVWDRTTSVHRIAIGGTTTIYFDTTSTQADRKDLRFWESELSQGPGIRNHVRNAAKQVELAQQLSPLSPEESLVRAGFQSIGFGNHRAYSRIDIEEGHGFGRYGLVAFATDFGISRLFLSEPSFNRSGIFNSPSLSVLSVVPDSDGHLVLELMNVHDNVIFNWKDGYVSNAKLLKPLDLLDPVTLGIQPPVTPFTESTGFKVGDKNSSDVIRSATSFNNIPVAELTAAMLPNQSGSDRSVSGFLAPDQDLRTVMATQNDYVVGTMKSSHQTVAAHLKYFMAAYDLGFYNVVYKGRRYRIEPFPHGGVQHSPFRDSTGRGGGFVLKRMDLDGDFVIAQVNVTPTCLAMIERWGFYEGTGLPFATEIVPLFKVLDFLNLGV